MQEEQWPPAGSTVVEEETQDDQWPPKGSQSIESSEPTEESKPPGMGKMSGDSSVVGSTPTNKTGIPQRGNPYPVGSKDYLKYETERMWFVQPFTDKSYDNTDMINQATNEAIVNPEIAALESKLYDSKAVQAANAKAEELAAAKAAQEEYEGSARTKRLKDEKLQKDKEYQKSLQKGGYIDKSFDYKHVEITQPDGSVRTYPYSQVQSNYGDVDEYVKRFQGKARIVDTCLLYTSPSPRDQRGSRMPSSA